MSCFVMYDGAIEESLHESRGFFTFDRAKNVDGRVQGKREESEKNQ